MALEQAKPYPKPAPAVKAAPKRLKSTRRSKDALAAGLFKEIVCADDDCLAEGLGECEPPLQAAHAVPAAVLRKFGREDLVYDPSNGVALCYRHHRRHDNWIEKLPRHLLPGRCFAWAQAHNLTDALKRSWPA